MYQISIQSHRRNEMIDITARVAEVVQKQGWEHGLVTVYSPHTTAGITINENADPSVVHDILAALERLVPHAQPYFTHREGNSDSHVKATLVGSSVQVEVEKGRLVLGTWQAIYFCEFDGPRERRAFVGFSPFMDSPGSHPSSRA